MVARQKNRLAFWLFILMLALPLLFCRAMPAMAGNPFTGNSDQAVRRAPAPEPKPASPLLLKITIWQHQLKQKMSSLIRAAKTGLDIKPLALLMALALLYGMIHAAGPGHGKAIATSYVFSYPVSVPRGIAFGFFLSAFHGFSGAVCVLALNVIIQQRVSDTLGSVTTVTQVVSFGLITLLGLGIVIHNGLAWLKKPEPTTDDGPAPQSYGSHPSGPSSSRGLLAWALTLGLVPCPAVVMVLLFCLSMDVLVLGLVLAACISLGMALTISTVVTIVILGKTGALNIFSEQKARRIEIIVGLLSGTTITCFGLIFFIAAIR